MKNYFSKLLLVLCIFACCGCKKYLELKSNSKLVTPHNLKDIQGILDDGEKINLRTTPALGESSADDYFILPASYGTLSLFTQSLYRWAPEDIRWGNDWNLAYQAIFNANLSLELLQKVERNSSNAQSWDNVKGSALFYRSFHFLNLVIQYGKVYNESTAERDMGIVLRTASDFNIPSTRSTVRETFVQLISDLEASIPLLPDYPLHKMRPSKGAVHALLARAYLYMGKYELARIAANEALKFNQTLMDYNADPSIVPASTSVSVRKLNSETIFYAEQGLSTIAHGITRARIDTNLMASYLPADLRRNVFFNFISGYAQFKGSYTGSSGIFFSGLATDELYLIRAESNAYVGEVDMAMNDLNELLKKRWNKSVPFSPITASTKAEALEKVRTERRKELLMRGLRWMDLKRYNREGANITIYRKINGQLITLQPNAAYYALPIPNDIIEQSGIPQN
ncbi:RagB/SusD family nutrient uptake outer membrane protein [Pedobacter agri]|uniref:RagB/SusD family nutrient uptake outer membrane protein n=1 Tax=Pedobacter agri TaxID=454586 RepID=A0A9X3I9T4_9SPHI|nr:RagB/SusD family nutrient uptake outer membrane protein [Pedobacter agri]MCX3265630.1 RagB/SusD family nutrient uptake outer membrane protein [Pedobacter agri]